jgi:hypothetical protein
LGGYSRDSACPRVSRPYATSQPPNLRHPHGEAVYHDVRVERLQDIARNQTVIDARVLVLLELRELVLPYVHHGGGVFSIVSRRDRAEGCEVWKYGGGKSVVLATISKAPGLVSRLACDGDDVGWGLAEHKEVRCEDTLVAISLAGYIDPTSI